VSEEEGVCMHVVCIHVVLQCVAVSCRVLQCVAVCCRVLQSVAENECSSVLQCVAAFALSKGRGKLVVELKS